MKEPTIVVQDNLYHPEKYQESPTKKTNAAPEIDFSFDRYSPRDKLGQEAGIGFGGLGGSMSGVAAGGCVVKLDADANPMSQKKADSKKAGGGGGPKKATRDTIDEIARKRDARRKEQKEEKARREEELLEHGDNEGRAFRRMVTEFRTKNGYKEGVTRGYKTPTIRSAKDGKQKRAQILVCVRKRPLNDSELDSYAYDVVSGMPDGSLVFHEPKIKFDLSKSMEHHHFVFDSTFEDGVHNPMVYADTLRPLLPSVIQEAAPVTMFAYGQTGSGKTYTMSSMMELAARDLFSAIESEDLYVNVYASFYEVTQSQK